MSDEAAAPTPVPVKLDPETLAIRARPERAIRFKRAMIVGIAALGSVSLMAVAWVALKPHALRQAAAQEELAAPASRPPADALSGLPSSYGDVPKLGPPLPGDLGRPILERQRQMADETGGPAIVAPASQVPPAMPADDRRADEAKAARQSAVLVQIQGARSTAALREPGDDATSLPGASTPSKPTLDLEHDPNAQGHKSEFVAALDPRGDINPHALTASPSPYVLSAGTVITASLITGLRSDLPGLVTAQVTTPVFDTPTGRVTLIPQGARLIGSYDSVVAFGQRRALVVWQRIVLPDGSSLRIDNVPATDAAGYAGLEDKVDFHTWSLLKGIALATLLGAGSDVALAGQGDLVQAIRLSTEDNVSRASGQITQRNLGVQPTITIRPGAIVRLVVHRDLILAPWDGGRDG